MKRSHAREVGPTATKFIDWQAYFFFLSSGGAQQRTAPTSWNNSSGSGPIERGNSESCRTWTKSETKEGPSGLEGVAQTGTISLLGCSLGQAKLSTKKSTAHFLVHFLFSVLRGRPRDNFDKRGGVKGRWAGSGCTRATLLQLTHKRHTPGTHACTSSVDRPTATRPRRRNTNVRYPFLLYPTMSTSSIVKYQIL